MSHGLRFIDEHIEFKYLVNKLFVNRELDNWYLEKCKVNSVTIEGLNLIEKVKKVKINDNLNPSFDIQLELSPVEGRGEFTLSQKIQLRISKLLPFYEIEYYHKFKHETLVGEIVLWGPPQTFDMLEAVDKLKKILLNNGYIELNQKYDSSDTVFRWDEVPNLDPVFRSLTVEQALFDDMLCLCD